MIPAILACLAATQHSRDEEDEARRRTEEQVRRERLCPMCGQEKPQDQPVFVTCSRGPMWSTCTQERHATTMPPGHTPYIRYL